MAFGVVEEKLSELTTKRRRKWREAIAEVEKAFDNLDSASERLADVYAPGTKTLLASAKGQTHIVLTAMRQLLRTMRE